MPVGKILMTNMITLKSYFERKRYIYGEEVNNKMRYYNQTNYPHVPYPTLTDLPELGRSDNR